MIVRGGIIPIISSDEAANFSHMRSVYERLHELGKVLSRKECIKIPAGQAFVIVGGRASIYDALEKRTETKFLSENASGIIVATHRAGSRVGSASRILGTSLKFGALAAAAPTGIAAVFRKGSTSKNYVSTMKQLIAAAKAPVETGKLIKRKGGVYTVVQVMGRDGGAHPDAIVSSPVSDLSSVGLFNALLGLRVIKKGKWKSGGKGGGVVSFGDDDDPDDVDQL